MIVTLVSPSFRVLAINCTVITLPPAPSVVVNTPVVESRVIAELLPDVIEKEADCSSAPDTTHEYLPVPPSVKDSGPTKYTAGGAMIYNSDDELNILFPNTA